MNLEDKKIAILSITNGGREKALEIKNHLKNTDAFTAIRKYMLKINPFKEFLRR